MEAFDSLVIDDTKESVKALVTNQLAKEKGTDVLNGKGKGLAILLHGSVIIIFGVSNDQTDTYQEDLGLERRSLQVILKP
jgi:hypothetical protein